MVSFLFSFFFVFWDLTKVDYCSEIKDILSKIETTKTVLGSNFSYPKTQLSRHKSGIARLPNVEFVTLPAKSGGPLGRFCWHSVTERNWPEPPRSWKWSYTIYRIRITFTFLLAKLWAFVCLWAQTNMDLPRRNIIGNLCIRLALHYCYGNHHHHIRQRLEGFRVDTERH